LTYDNRINRRIVLSGLAASTFLASCQPAARSFDADVIILGAGLSGLYAAYILAREGRKVLILEGSDRIGGRMHTIYHNGYHTEGGGEQIGASYARLIDRAQTLEIDLQPSNRPRSGPCYYYQDHLYSSEDWQTYAAHPLNGPFKGGSPSRAFFGFAGPINPLKHAGDWRNPDHANFDISAEKFLLGHEVDRNGLAYIDQALNANALNSYSMMNVYRTLFLFNQSRSMGPSLYVKGGVQSLMNAMAKGHEIKTNQKVSQIEVTNNAVEILTEKGQIFRAAHCICALPFGALRQVKIKAPLNTRQKEAINNLPYTQILQIHFEVEKPYWEIDQKAADMWTDLPMERVFANQTLDGDYTGLARMWINGTGAAHLNSKSDAEISDLARSWMQKVRPDAGKINVYHIQRWTRSNPLAGGAYMHWGPGQIGQWADQMGEPSANLYFCGEHLSHLHTGMEGAMESAEIAAFRLLDN